MRKNIYLFLFLLIIGGWIWAHDQKSEDRLSLTGLMERAEKGDAKALYEVARLYESGYDSISVDSIKSILYYKLSADKGYAPAMNYLGYKYYLGSGVRRDVDSALYLIRKAAGEGDITAAANLGYLLTESKDFPHDEEEATKWISIAAEGGIMQAQFKMIEIMGNTWKDLSVDSALNLGMKYYLNKAPVMGIKLIQLAADKKTPKALALLGDAYSKGRGVPYDHKKSTEYFYMAACEGDPSAQFIIAEMLEIFPEALQSIEKRNPTNDKDFESPSFWYEKAAQSGVKDAESAYRELLAIPSR